MRILAIRGRNLASLRGEFEVALNKPPLEQAGLFAITGQTGAGKSTLLDAMCLALFDKVPRLQGSVAVKVGHQDEDEKLRISSNDVASLLSRGTANAYAQVDFVGVDKKTYQAHWEIKRARNKVSGKLQKQTLKLISLENKQIIGQNKSDTLEEICARIGLNFEQFRRSVLLAQGDFSAFLKARSDERSALLERITGTEIYTQISIAAFRKFQQEDQLYDQIQQRMNHDLPLENLQRQDLNIQLRELSDEQQELNTACQEYKDILLWRLQREKLCADRDAAEHTFKNLQKEKIEKASQEKEFHQLIAIQGLRSLEASLVQLEYKQSFLEKQIQSARSENASAKENEKQRVLNVEIIQRQLKAQKTHYQLLKPALLQARELDTQLKLMLHERQQQEQKVQQLSREVITLKHQQTDLDEIHKEQKSLDELLQQQNNKLGELQEQKTVLPLEQIAEKKENTQQQLALFQEIKRLHSSYHENYTVIIKHQQEQDKGQIRQQELTDNIALKKADQIKKSAIVVEAKRALLLMQETVTEGAQSLRSLLKDNQACAVCGSLEHPWADQDLKLNEQYHAQQERVSELEQQAQAALIEVNHLQQQEIHLQVELKKNIAVIKTQQSRLNSLTEQWQTISAAYEFSQRLKEPSVEDELFTEIEQQSLRLKMYQQQEKQANFVQRELDQCQKNKDKLQAREKELDKNLSEQQLLINNIKNKNDHQEKIQGDIEQRLQDEKVLLKQRQFLFVGDFSQMEVNEIEHFFVDSITTLDTKNDNEKQLLNKSKQEQVSSAQLCQQLVQQLDELKIEQENQSHQLNEALKKQAVSLQELKTLLKKDEQWISQQKDIFEQLNQSLIKMDTLLLERNSKLEQHQQILQTLNPQLFDLASDTIEQRLQEKTHLAQTLHSQQQEKQLQLKQDDDRKQRMAQNLQELNVQKEHWKQWGALNDLIGSASGHKFRIFAQSLTLESLLAYANEHLNDFARRYQLQRVPATDLDLQIIDRDMADEVRSVQSLSGGESFLVSLALALGLASLSSSKTQVESLFIDEGFGTLDQETLDVAIASLDTLQGLGRKVGIISHVPLLVERIGIQVVVEKLGGGHSRVLVKS